MVIIRIASKCAALMPHARILAPACTHTHATHAHMHTRVDASTQSARSSHFDDCKLNSFHIKLYFNFYKIKKGIVRGLWQHALQNTAVLHVWLRIDRIVCLYIRQKDTWKNGKKEKKEKRKDFFGG